MCQQELPAGACEVSSALLVMSVLEVILATILFIRNFQSVYLGNSTLVIMFSGIELFPISFSRNVFDKFATPSAIAFIGIPYLLKAIVFITWEV